MSITISPSGIGFWPYSRLWNDHYEPNYWNSASSPAGFNQFIKSHTLVLDQIVDAAPDLSSTCGMASRGSGISGIRIRSGRISGALGFSQLYTTQVQERFLPAISINGFNGNDETGNQRFTRYCHNLAAAVSMVRRSHKMKFGWDGRMFMDHNASLGNPGGNFSFGTTSHNRARIRSQGAPAGQAPYFGLRHSCWAFRPVD